MARRAPHLRAACNASRALAGRLARNLGTPQLAGRTCTAAGKECRGFQARRGRIGLPRQPAHEASQPFRTCRAPSLHRGTAVAPVADMPPHASHHLPHLLVTGATGFVGAPLLRTLLAAGYRITAISRDSGNQRLHGEAHPALRWLQGDVSLPLLGIDPRDLGKVHGILHMAALPKLSQLDPIAARTVHVGGALEVGRLAASLDVERVVHLSTAFVPADSSNAPLGECLPGRVGANIYETTKAMAEHVLARMVGGRLLVLRPAIVIADPLAYRTESERSPLAQFGAALARLGSRWSAESALPLPGSAETCLGLVRAATLRAEIMRGLVKPPGASPVFRNLVSLSGPTLGDLASAMEHRWARRVRFGHAVPAAVQRALGPWSGYMSQQRHWLGDDCEAMPLGVDEIFASGLGLHLATPDMVCAA